MSTTGREQKTKILQHRMRLDRLLIRIVAFGMIVLFGLVTNPVLSEDLDAMLRDSLSKISQRQVTQAQVTQAIDQLERIGRLGPIGSVQRIAALATICIYQSNSGTCDLKRAVDVLHESLLLENQNRDAYNHIQFELLSAITFTNLLARLNKLNPVDVRQKKLNDQLNELEKRIIDRGIPVGIAKLVRMAEVQMAIDTQNFVAARETLKSISPVMESPNIAAQWKGFYWNKEADIELQLLNLAGALRACRQFAAIARDSNSRLMIVHSDDQLAHLHIRMGDYAMARKLLEGPRNISAEEVDEVQYVNSRLDLALAMEGETQFMDARKILMDCERVSKNTSEFSPIIKARLLNKIGMNSYLTGKIDEAQSRFEESRQIISKPGLSNPLTVAEFKINHGWLELAAERPTEAARLFDEAGALVSKITSENHNRFAESLAAAARAYTVIGSKAKARERIERAEALAIAKLRQDLLSISDPRDRFAIVQEARIHPESIAWPGVLDSYLELAPALEIPATKQWEIVTGWKGILDRLQNASQTNNFFRQTLEVKQLEQQLKDLYFRVGGDAERKVWNKEIESIQTKLRELQRGINIEATASNESKFSLSQHMSLPPETALLSIVQVRKYQPPQANTISEPAGEFIGFLISDGKIVRVSLGETKALELAIAEWRNRIILLKDDNHAAALAAERAAANRVAKMVQQPLLPWLTTHRRLIIDADGVCYNLPWGALPGTDGKTYWIEQMEFENVHSLMIHEQKTNKGSEPNKGLEPNFLIVGDVDYGPFTKNLSKLTMGASEIEDIKKILNQSFPRSKVDVVQSGMANKKRVTEKMEGKNFVYFSTHGFYRERAQRDAFALVDSTTSFDTGLFLAPPEKPNPSAVSLASQVLAADEIMAMDLHELELVVLSACESGLGNLKAGQGMDSLVASFHSAGARQTLSSLWKMDEHATAEFVKRFHAYYFSEKYPATEALRVVQRQFIQGGDPELKEKWKSPFHWAAFSVSHRGLPLSSAN